MKCRTAELEERWQKRFRISEIFWTQVAKAETTRGLAASNQSGVMQLYVWDIPGGRMTQLTHNPTGKMLGILSPDGAFVYYLKDEGSNEIGHFVRVPFEGGGEEDITPDLMPYASHSLAFSRDMSCLAFIAADADGFKIYTINIDGRSRLTPPRLLYTSHNLLQQQAVSADGKTLVVNSTELSGKLFLNLLALDTSGGAKIGELWDGGETTLQCVSFSPQSGDGRLLGSSNQSSFTRPLLWNPRTGERLNVALPELQGDVIPLDWSPDGKRLLLENVHQAVQQFYIYNLETIELIKLNHPEGSFMAFAGLGTYFYSNNEIFTTWQNSTNPPQVIALDAESGARKRVIIPGAIVPDCKPWKSVHFLSSDEQRIQAWLGLPEGDGPFPTIVHTHGGPSGVLTNSFDAQSQTWLDHGFAFLSINYRGSTTFGKDFQNQIVGDLGHWEVEDVKAGVRWLVDNGIADPRRILKTGWSYGGYMTLMSLGKLPDLFAGGIAGIAIADWMLMYEDQARTLRGYQVALFGGTPETRSEQYRISSPITYAENVRSPVLIIQGRNDTRCPIRQMEAYLDRMKELGKEVRIEWFDAGHGSLKVEESI